MDVAIDRNLRKYTSRKKERKVTRIFFLKKEGRQKMQVCQVMYLS